MEGGPKQFQSPEEEIAFLREQIAFKERELLARAPEADHKELETVAKKQLHEYGTFTPNSVLKGDHQMDEPEVTAAAAAVEVAHSPVEEVVAIARERGIHNALSVMEKTATAFSTDEVHAKLVELIKSGVQVQDLKEGVPPWQILHMTLFEVTLPEPTEHGGREYQLAELFGMMEQFFSGMQSVGLQKQREHYVIEIANPEGSDNIAFYVAVPNQYIDLFQKQILSLYPNAVLMEQQHDYNIFVEGGTSDVAVASLKKYPLYPLRNPETFDSDPLSVILNAFSKIDRDGGGAALQFIMRTAPQRYISDYQGIIRRVRDGVKPKEAILRSSISGELYSGLKDMFKTATKKDDAIDTPKDVDQDALQQFEEKIKSPIIETNIRIAVSSKTPGRASQIRSEIEATFNQFASTVGNQLQFKTLAGTAEKSAIKAFSFREFNKDKVVPLSIDELSALIHFPGNGVESSPEFKQSRAKTAAAPSEMPENGTLLGVNKHRGSEKEIYVTELDRARHFYIIGQTGTGKSVFMQNLVVQDIQQGHGVCMIDPHGSDIEDILGAIPPERHDDVIYFDPSNLDHVMGLNMLEYDENKPEQKTFVVNELFSIFQKLYGANPESMGPMFEQYFRNATLLVMEHPESGSTLMDISRVMSDAKYRRLKLEHATNPVVVQFWQEIATKAGGEASLENIVPYIVSKFDVFTANDYMRPIIGQQESTFNFRKVMDEKKILLVNLSKGRLGEINANLIGMIMVGKILMAALSRVDDPTKSFPPFYLHIDEFQNVSTPAIASILSEARKYKLGLVMAHQFIAQLDETIRDAVFGNVGSMATFRVGPEDAHTLEKQLEPVFEAKDIMNIPNYQAYLKILANGTPTKPFSVFTEPPPESDPELIAKIKQLSLSKYGRPRAAIEADIAARYQKKTEDKPTLPDNPFAKL